MRLENTVPTRRRTGPATWDYADSSGIAPTPARERAWVNGWAAAVTTTPTDVTPRGGYSDVCLPSHESHGRGASRAIDLTHGLERLKTGFRNAPHWRTRSAAEVYPTQYAHCLVADATSTRVCRVYRMGLRSHVRRSAQWYANGVECPPSEPSPSVRTEIRLDGNDETHTRIPARPTANI